MFAIDYSIWAHNIYYQTLPPPYYTVPALYKIRKIIPFYIFAELLPPTITAFLILFVLVLCQQLSRNSEILLSSLVGLNVTGKILFYLLPPIVTFTLPVAIAIGSILGLTRISSDTEWVIFEASPVTSVSKFGPFFLLGTLGSIIILLLNWSWAPSAADKLRELRSNVQLVNATSLVRPQAFISQYENHLLRIRNIDTSSGTWQGVFLIKKNKVDNNLQLMAAQSGTIAQAKETSNANVAEVKLRNGIYIDNFLSKADHVTSAFSETTMRVGNNLKTSVTSPAASTVNLIQTASLTHLLEKVFRGQSLNQKDYIETTLEIHKRFLFSLAAFYAILCTVVLGDKARARQIQRSTSITLSLLLIIGYYTCLINLPNLCLKGYISLPQTIALTLISPSVVLLFFYKTRVSNLGNYFSKNDITHKSHLEESSPLQRKLAPSKSFWQAFQQKTVLDIPVFSYGHYLLISEFIKFFLMATLILTGVILLFTYLDIVPSLAKNEIKSLFAVAYLLQLAPQLIYYVAPFCILVAMTACATALARQGQLTVLLYYSRTPFRLLWPILGFTSLVFIGLVVLSDTILPFSNREQDRKYKIIKGRPIEETTIAFERQWIADENAGIIYGIQATQNGQGGKRVNAIVLRQTNPSYYLDEISYFDFDEAWINNPPQQQLDTSFSFSIAKDGKAEMHPLTSSDIPVALREPKNLLKTHFQDATKLTRTELKSYIKQLGSIGLSTSSLEMELMQKIAFPFSCLTLLALALPISLTLVKRKNQARSTVMVVSILAALVFWSVITIFGALGKNEVISLPLAAWSPHALFLALSLVLHLKAH